jgi:hypothetical protein
MLVITGTGRSGTSLLIRTLAHAGIKTGPMEPVFGEHVPALAIDRAVLERRGYLPWTDLDAVAESVRARVLAVEAEALKDTALCHTLDVWWRIRQDLRLIVCHRRLDKVTKSFLAAYPEGQRELVPIGYPPSIGDVPHDSWMPLAFGLLMDVVIANRIPHGYFYFPDDIADPNAAWDRLAFLLAPIIDRAAFAHALGAVADPALVHW